MPAPSPSRAEPLQKNLKVPWNSLPPDFVRTFANPPWARLYSALAPEVLISISWIDSRSEEHTSELQSRPHLVCRLLLEKKHSNDPTLVNLARVQTHIVHVA